MDTKHCIQVYSGEFLDIFNSNISKINIKDIAHALSQICRFAGHSKKFYSVAQHSILVSFLAEKIAKDNKIIVAKWGLLHDSVEFATNDLPRPIKKAIPVFSQIEENFLKVIAQKYNLPLIMPKEIRMADDIMLMTEKKYLLKKSKEKWELENKVKPLAQPIIPCDPESAELLFLTRFKELFGRIKNIH